MSHTCHARSCSVVVPPKLFMCRTHWFMLPRPLREAIWRAYRPGQEQRKSPSPQYLKVARQAIDWLWNREQELAAQGPTKRQGDLFE